MARYCPRAATVVVPLLLAAVAAAPEQQLDAAACADTAPPDTPILLPSATQPYLRLADDDRLQWLHDGSPLLQGWGSPYQTMLVQSAATNSSFVSALQREFGFSAVILNVPGTSGWGGSTPDVFKRAVQAYASAGMGVVLYSSIVHAGEDPAWTSGNLSRDNPGWLQRRADGSPWLLETKPALTPAADAAVEWTLNRTLGLLREFPQASAIMLDNSELCPGTGLCDYSSAALAKWQAYLTARFPAEWARRCLNLSDRAAAPLPTAVQIGSPLYGVFTHFRNRLNARGLERFRSVLHVLPGEPVGLFANTELEWPNAALATRLQPHHEDAILTESYDTGAAAVSKAQLSSAMAPSVDFPVYNFLGSFEKTDYKKLLPPQLALSQLAATLMARAKPWLVYYGLDTPSASRRIIGNLLRFRGAKPDLYDKKELAAASPLVAVLSPLSTELRGERQVGSWFEAARVLGVPVRLASSERLCTELTDAVRVLLMQNVSVMPRADAECVNGWVKQSGGTLIHRLNSTAMFDEIGQLRSTSAVLLGPRVLNNVDDELSIESTSAVKDLAWVEGSGSGAAQWQLTPYTNSSTLVLHGLLLSSGGGSDKCPAAGHPYIYGSDSAGWYCCSVPATTSCAGTLCCEKPGTTSGCQGNPRCVKRGGDGASVSNHDPPLTRPMANSTSLSMAIPLTRLLNFSAEEPLTAQVSIWAPATGMLDSAASSRAAGLRSWVKEDSLQVELAAAPSYFVLTARLDQVDGDARLDRLQNADRRLKTTDMMALQTSRACPRTDCWPEELH